MYSHFQNRAENSHFCIHLCPHARTDTENPQNTEKFYEDLEGIINTTSCRHLLTIAGDLNAKAGAGHTDYPDNIGRYGKGEINQNGQYLAEMLHRTDMYLTNTTFKHKMSHRTTWEAPPRSETHKDKDRKMRRNPYRNQIDYIIGRTSQKIFYQDSRSYSGIETPTDHRLVRATMKIEWYRIKPAMKTTKLNLDDLRNPETQRRYKEEVKNRLENMIATTAQEKWTSIQKACKEAAENTLEKKVRTQKIENEEIKELSENN